MRGFDQLHAPKRDDRAPLPHRTHLQRVWRSGACHNPEEMRAVGVNKFRRQLCCFLLPHRLCAMSILLEMIGRGWENLLARPNGPLSLRFYVQPTMASLLALRAGIQDARQGRQGYLWAILTRPERRLQLLHEGWRGAMTPFLLAIALDCIYQLMTVRFVYPLELLFTATLLALVPYALLRGPFNRLARLFLPAGSAPPPVVRPTNNNTFIH